MSRLNTNIDFLIVTALNIERDAVLEHIGHFELIPIDDEIPTYYQTEIHLPNKIETYKVTLVMLLGTGNVQAGVLSKKVIEKLRPKHVIMLGIAGGILKNGVKIGDIVVGTSIGYYEPTKSFPDKLQRRIEGALTDALLIDRFKNFNYNNWINEISIDPPENHYNPNVHFGLIASGEIVVASEPFINELLAYFPKMLAVETESWGVLIAAWMSKNLPRFIPVRGISDNAIISKGDKWQKFAAHTAALYLKHFLQSQPVIPSMGYLPNEFNWIDKVYVPPLEFEEISKTLEEKRIVFITGTPEYGKTYTAIYLMWKYYNLGYKPEWIRGGSQGERVEVRNRLQTMKDLKLEPEIKKILYFEDPFGKIKYEERYDLEREIFSILEEIKNVKDLYVIITSREEVFKEFKKRASSGTHLEVFEERLSIGKPSYTTEKRKEILTNWAIFKKCTWLSNEELNNFVLNQIESKKNLPTLLNIREFVGASININVKEDILTMINQKSQGTTWAFLKEIKEMTNDKVLFLTILYVLGYPREEFFKETYQNLISHLNLENTKKFNDVFNWFFEDKIKITFQDRIMFSHSSYSEAMEALISEFEDYNEIFIGLLKYLAEKDEAVGAVALVITGLYDRLPEDVRQIFFTIAEKLGTAWDVANAIIVNFDNLPEDVRQMLFTVAELDEAAWGIASTITGLYDRLPKDVRQIIFTLAEKDEEAWDVTVAIIQNFDRLPENVRQIIFTLAEKDETAAYVASAIIQNFDRLPENVRQIIFTLAEKDETAAYVASAIMGSFDRLPENVRQIIFTLAEKDETAADVAFYLSFYFHRLPENERNEILLNLSNIKPAQKIVAEILQKYYNHIPEPLRKEIKSRLKIRRRFRRRLIK